MPRCSQCRKVAQIFRVSASGDLCLTCKPYVELQERLDEAVGSFSFVSNGVRLTYDFRRIYNRVILAREWQ